jgi:hypothetical protein
MTAESSWYYAEGDKPVGPLSLTELLSAFARVSDAAKILVWRNGFSTWQRAESVAEIARHVLKPPPIPSTDTPRPALRTTPSPQATNGETEKWWCRQFGIQYGPMSLSEFKDKLRGVDTREVFLRNSFEDWKRLEDVPEFRAEGQKPPDSITVGEVRSPLATKKKELVGIGGWLIVVALGQALGPPRFVVTSLTYFSSLQADLWETFPVAAYGEAILYASVLVIMCWSTYLFFTKSSLFPRFFIFQYAAAILLYPLDIIWSATTLSAYTGKAVEDILDTMIDPKGLGQWIALLIAAAIWIPYILRSKRVANTFAPRSAASSVPQSQFALTNIK